MGMMKDMMKLNPFADMSEDYTKKKEEQLVKNSVKRMSAQQQQISQVRRV